MNVAYWNQLSKNWQLQDVLNFSLEQFSPRLAFGCSFSLEDLVLLHHLLAYKERIEIFYLDTGRLHEETYQLIAEVEKRYDLQIKPYVPNGKNLQKLIEQQGVNGFYDSIDRRMKCCRVRKVEPLSRALKDHKAWITGLRRQQSAFRSELNYFQDDADHRIKINPLRDWSFSDISNYQKKWRLPINKLYQKGYQSIGCAPCTRPVVENELGREGRWWWEKNSKKECGLHIRPKGDGRGTFQP